MKKVLPIPEVTSDAGINIALDTIAQHKQGLFFLNSKRNAESLAEKIAEKIKTTLDEELAAKALHLPKPTKQCQRLALVLRKDIAFHHAGLTSTQRELIEEEFRKGRIKIICATPTLAMGIDLPAFRAVIRDIHRFGLRGMAPIPVLEYEQQSGRAGRPGKDDYGEAILIASTEKEKEMLKETYIDGSPEHIFSKLAVEPVFRTYCLSLIASDYVKDVEELRGFFAKTFYAHQYGDMKKLHTLLDRVLQQLEEWGFVNDPEHDDFVSADSLVRRGATIKASLIGKRTSELYLDPFTARFILDCVLVTRKKTPTDFSYLHMLASCLEMKPLLRTKAREQEEIQGMITKYSESLLVKEPSFYDEEYDEFVHACKTALFLLDWINEVNEDDLLNKYDIRPGEIRVKLDIADWLLYATEELARLSKNHGVISDVRKLRMRLKHGAKEELLPLLQLRNIGRVRARLLFRNNLKTLDAIRHADLSLLSSILGKKIAEDIYAQVGNQEAEDQPAQAERPDVDREV